MKINRLASGSCRPAGRVALALAAATLFMPAGPAKADTGPRHPGSSRYTLALEPVAEHAGENAIDLTHAGDGTGRFFVSTQSGQVFAFDEDGQPLGVFLDIAQARPDFTRTDGAFNGLMYVAFHPDFGRTGAPGQGRFYTSHQVVVDDTPADFDSKDHGAVGDSDVRFAIAEWRVDPADPDRIDPASYRRVLLLNFHTTGSNPHAVGELAFNPYARPGEADYGKLYLAVGDSNNRNDSGGTALAYAQRADNPFAKILRIDPLGDGSRPYTIPADNPFTADGLAGDDASSPRTEVFAIGVRNSQSFSFAKDLDGHAVIVAFDMGAGTAEEVNLIRPGGNYGWDHLEGTLVYEPKRHLASPARPPVAQYGHTFPTHPGDDPSGGPAAVVGGFVVTDADDKYFQGQVLFADLPRGTFFHTNLHETLTAEQRGEQAKLYVMDAELSGKRGTFADVIGADRADVRFGVDEAGRLYLVSKQTGTIYRTKLVYTGEPVPAPPMSLARAMTGGGPWPFLIGGVVVLGLIGGFVFVTVRAGRKRETAKTAEPAPLSRAA